MLMGCSFSAPFGNVPPYLCMCMGVCAHTHTLLPWNRLLPPGHVSVSPFCGPIVGYLDGTYSPVRPCLVFIALTDRRCGINRKIRWCSPRRREEGHTGLHDESLTRTSMTETKELNSGFGRRTGVLHNSLRLLRPAAPDSRMHVHEWPSASLLLTSHYLPWFFWVLALKSSWRMTDCGNEPAVWRVFTAREFMGKPWDYFFFLVLSFSFQPFGGGVGVSPQ